MATEKWYYVGQRISDKKLYHGWQAEGTTTLSLYKKLGGIVGAAYAVEVDRTDSKTTVKMPIKLLDDEPQHEQADAWVAADTAERTRFVQAQRDAKLVRESRDLGWLTLAQVARQYGGLNGAQRPAFLAQVLARIMREG